jgi:hypothetical protein
LTRNVAQLILSPNHPFAGSATIDELGQQPAVTVRRKEKWGANVNIRILMLACAGIFIASPLKADTRDEVLAGVQRCGVIQDDRAWLDCMYGAQQPMRARLALPPAPEFQQRLVPAIQPGAPRATPSAAAPVAKPLPRRKPGFFESLVGDVPAYAVSRMASYRYLKGGAFVVTLENGQEWRQTDADGGTVLWTKKPSAYLAKITSGSFGSFALSTDDSPRSYRVERIR